MRSDTISVIGSTGIRGAHLRNPRLGLIVLCVALALAALTLVLPAGRALGRPVRRGDGAAAASSSSSPDYAPGVVLVSLKPGEDIHRVTAQLSSLGSTGVKRADALFPFAQRAGTALQASAASKLARIFRLQLTPEVEIPAVLAALKANPAVEFAEPDYIARPALAPNDPLYADQWGLDAIGAESAWDVATGDASAIIAILDSGIDLTHEDLSGQLWTNPGETAGNGIDDDSNGLVDDVHGWNFLADSGDVTDDNGHGSQVAGVAGAASNNGLGVAGVCWDCRLMAVKVMQASGVVNYSDIAAGVAYAAGQGAQVINLSLGGYADSETLRTAIESAAATTVIVAGAGNDDSTNPFYPAAYPEVIAVAGTDQTNGKASFSNYGSWVDVAAPGVEIKTTFAGNNSYGSESGTSLSAPFAAGLAGLLTGQHPDWSPALVREHILHTAVSIDGVNPGYAGQLGQGLVSAAEAVTTDPQPSMEVTAWALDGQEGALPEPGESYQLALTLYNVWLPARGVAATLSDSDPYVSVSDSSGSFGDLNTGQSAANGGDPFAITLQSNTPYNREILFTLSLSGDGGYELTIPFSLIVRSGIEEILAGTTLVQDGTWTNDKTYVLQGNVVVDVGVTLTIEPGTLVQVYPASWMRVDGTLIADGSADSPIVFTTDSATHSRWAGLRFTDNSGAAAFDAGGSYVSGSILRHVEMSYAETAISMLSRAPYIADSSFHNNTTALNTGAGSPRIERCTFSGNTIAINLGSSPTLAGAAPAAVSSTTGSPVIALNTLTGNGTGISGSGSPTIISNTLASNTGMAINSSSYGSNAPTIRDNRIVGNGGGVYLSELQGADIEHNLIANNGNSGGWEGNGAALYLNLSSSGFSQSSPDLAYNPDGDQYLLVWSESSDGAGYDIKAQRVLSDGQSIGSVMNLGPGYGASAVYNPVHHEFFVSWFDHGGVGGGGIAGRRISADGVPLGDLSVISDAAATTNARVSYLAASNTYLVAWQDYSTSPSTIYARHVLADGSPSGPASSIGAEIAEINLGDVAYDSVGDRSLVVFRGNRESGEDYCGGCLFGAWVTGTLTQSVPAFNLARDPDGYHIYSTPRAAANATEGELYVSWYQEKNSQYYLYGRVITESGVLTGTHLSDYTTVYSTTAYIGAARAEYAPDQGRYLVVWSADAMMDNNRRIGGIQVDADGTPAGEPFAISSPGDSYSRYSPVPALNSQQDEFLTVWVDGRNGSSSIYGQRLSAGGQLLDNAWSGPDETDPAVNFPLTQGRGVRNNTIINNAGYGLDIGGSAAQSVLIAENNWFGNGTYDVYMRAANDVSILGNYWGAVSTSQIGARIYDCNDTEFGCGSSQTSIGELFWNPALAGPDQTAPAFAQAVTVSPDPLGIEQGTFEVSFSRPMITATLPALSFHDSRRGTLEDIAEVTAYVSSLAVDAIGRLWAGSLPGVFRYDFVEWTNLTIDNSGLASNATNAIHGASNGDVWFGHDSGRLSRLQGSTWITYTPESTGYALPWSGIAAIGEDGQANIWIGCSMDGAARFDGSEWRRFTTEDGLVSNHVQRIARDGQGRMWFSTELGLSVYDGISWTTYDQSPFSSGTNALFADSQGRIWVGLSLYDGSNWEDSIYAGMFDGTAWNFYGPGNTNGMLSGAVYAFAEDPDGKIWASAGGGSPAIFDGSRWTCSMDTGSLYSPFLFDARGNLWMRRDMAGLRVLWGGSDYPVVDNGQWISSTLYHATYDLNPIVVPKGTYAVQVEGAAGLDEMDIAPDASETFEVAYAGFVSDDTAPSRPVVTAVNDGGLSTLTINWTSSDPEGIAQYRYALGTTAGGRDVIDWKYVPSTSSSVRLTGLLLVEGETYYGVVQAQNTSGLWSEVGVSNPVVAGESPDETPPTTPEVAAYNDGTTATISLSWTSSDPESGIAQYRYALGTTAGAQDVLDWTYTVATAVTVTGLIEGETYYGAVQAQNTSGLWSEVGVSNPVAAGQSPDETPPTTPMVTAYNDGGLTGISLSWSSSDPESGINQYRYALGTTAGAQDVLDWTYAATGTTSVNVTGLTLVEGQSYYGAVQAQNNSGLWSEVGVSNPVVAGEETVIQQYIYLPLVLR